MRGRKQIPTAMRKGGPKAGEPVPHRALPRCPAHLCPVAQREWRRLAKPLHDMGVLYTTDRAALAAYCQAYARWVEAEQKLKETPILLKTPSGYVQQSPWLSVSNKQLELMGRFMAELGLTPAARRRVEVPVDAPGDTTVRIERIIIGGPNDSVRKGDPDGCPTPPGPDCKDADVVFKVEMDGD
ncbi:MAG: phage terminase small subunit P27 family [Maritimibacter sp.]|nr:phage terminase small subunit P27 family [Maritimibacter sp.]